MVRCDLPIGTLSAQLVHAAGESSTGDLSAGTYAVVLGVPDEAALKALSARLERAGIEHVRIFEPDEPWNNGLMAIGLRPALRSVLRRHLSDVPLFRGSTFTPESSNRGHLERGNGGSSPSSGTISSGAVAQR